MKKLEAVRNVVLIVGVLACFSALRKDPIETFNLYVGYCSLSAGFILEAFRAMVIWTHPEL